MSIANKDNVTKYSDVNRTLTRVEMDQNFQEVKNVITDVKAFESNFENRLGNVDNTSDMDKPVSIAQGQAIQSVRDEVTKVRTDLAAADEDYGAGVVIERRNQTIWRDGIPYRPNATLELPYTITGDWSAEEGLFVAVGDASLRQELANPDKGALLVRGAVIYVNAVDDLQTLDTSELVDGQVASVQGSTFRWENQEWVPDWPVSLRAFGALGDGITNDTQSFRNAVNYCIERSGHLYIPSGVYILSARNDFEDIPNETRLTISGDGPASILKMEDGGITGRYHRLTLWSPAEGASVWLTFKNFNVDNNARNSPLDPEGGAFQFEQAHTFQISGSDGIFESVVFENVNVKDPVADVFNCGSRTCREYRVVNCGVTERTRSRSDIQFSVLPNKITVSDFNGDVIEAEPVASSILDPDVVWNMSNINVRRLDLGIGGHIDGGRVSINIANSSVSRSFYITGGRTVANVVNSVLRAGWLGDRNTYLLGTLLRDSSFSRISGCTILLPANNEGGGNGVNADRSKIIFSNCEFQIDSDAQIDFDIIGVSSPSAVAISTEEHKIPKYIVDNCTFDDRLRESIDAFRNGIWSIKNSDLSGHNRALYVGATSSTHISEVTVDSCDFRRVRGYGFRIERIVSPRSILTLTGDHLGEAACDFRHDAGSRDSINVVSSRRVIIDSTEKEIPILSNNYGLKGDTLVRKAAPSGEPISWYRVDYTANGWRCKEQAGISNYSTLPSANPTDAGWQILYNNVLTIWDGSNWRLSDGTVVT